MIRSPRPDRHQPDLGIQNTDTPKPSHSTAVFSASGGRRSVLRENREPIRDFTGSGLYEFNLLITDLRGLVSTLSRVTTRLERSPGDFLFGSRRGVETQ